ncbi:MAG: hypothetical protein H8E43_11625 [Planctomycetia bacterium]|nr:hypothetical protein [Planctomycetia bacterium]HCW45513.1 hypothetical protein [Planctomycetota bacterium]
MTLNPHFFLNITLKLNCSRTDGSSSDDRVQMMVPMGDLSRDLIEEVWQRRGEVATVSIIGIDKK